MNIFVQKQKIVFMGIKSLEYAMNVKMDIIQIIKMENVNQIQKIMILNIVKQLMENALNV